MEPKTSYKLSEEEEMMALDSLSGVNLLDSFRKAYPNTTINDVKARSRAKSILQRPRVVLYVEHLRNSGDLSPQLSKETLETFLWNICLANKTNSVGLKAALALGAKYGIGSKEREEKNDDTYDDELLAIHNYYDAISRGEHPEMPNILSEDKTVPEEIEFEVIGKDDGVPYE